ncbi:MAG: Carbohydrate binding family 6, partial [Chloroflexi bacterium]|nr:Carbohydrate binding family 6 [Chloroflexota bacterium]
MDVARKRYAGAFTRLALAGGLMLSGALVAPPSWQTPAHARATAPRGVAAVTSQVRYEAEDAWLTGGPVVRSGIPNHSGSGYVTGFSKVGSTAVFAVSIPADGLYSVRLRYANSAPAAKTLTVLANGLNPQQISLPPTGSGRTWADKTDILSLRAGVNTLSYAYGSGSNGNVSLDYLSVAGGSVPARRGATVPYVEYQ